jgi:hypothetical protein
MRTQSRRLRSMSSLMHFGKGLHHGDLRSDRRRDCWKNTASLWKVLLHMQSEFGPSIFIQLRSGRQYAERSTILKESMRAGCAR